MIMTDFKKFQLAVFIILITLLISGSLLAQDNKQIPFDKLKTPTKLQDIIDTFDRLKYNFVSFKKEEKVQEVVIEFQYQGKEDVDGEQADKIFITTSTMNASETSKMDLWLADGEIVKMIQNNQEIPPAMAESMKEQILQAVFYPFYNLKEMNIEEIAAKGEVTKSQEIIDEKEVDIFEIEGNNLAEYGLESGNIKLIDFGEFIMVEVFDYEYLEEVEAKFEEGQFEIKEIELR